MYVLCAIRPLADSITTTKNRYYERILEKAAPFEKDEQAVETFEAPNGSKPSKHAMPTNQTNNLP